MNRDIILCDQMNALGMPYIQGLSFKNIKQINFLTTDVDFHTRYKIVFKSSYIFLISDVEFNTYPKDTLTQTDILTSLNISIIKQINIIYRNNLKFNNKFTVKDGISIKDVVHGLFRLKEIELNKNKITFHWVLEYNLLEIPCMNLENILEGIY